MLQLQLIGNMLTLSSYYRFSKLIAVFFDFNVFYYVNKEAGIAFISLLLKVDTKHDCNEIISEALN